MMNYTKYNSKLYISIATLMLLLSSVSAQQLSSIQKDSLSKVAAALLEKGIAINEINLDSSFYYKEQAALTYKQAENWEGYIECLNNVTVVHYHKAEYEKAMLSTEQALEVAKKRKIGRTTAAYSQAINNLSVFTSQKGNYEQAITLLKESIDIQRLIDPKKSIMATLYHNLGQSNNKKGDVDEAIRYFNKALELRLDTFGQANIEVARNYLVLGNVNRDKGEWTSALEHYQTALNISEMPNIPQNRRALNTKIHCYQNTGEIYFQQNDFKRGQEQLNKVLALQVDDKSYRKSLSYQILGNAYLDKADYKNAVMYFEKSKALAAIEYGVYEKHNVIAERSENLIKAFLAQKDYDAALRYAKLALEELSFNFSAQDVYQNPTVDDLYSKTHGLDVLIWKAVAFYEKHLKQEKDNKDLVAAYETYQLAAEAIQFLRADFSAVGSKYILAEKALTVYEKGIQTAINLHDKTGEQKYLDQAFTFAESNKATVLLESIQENTAKVFSGIPDSLLQLEKSLRLDISFYEKKISQNKGKNKAANEAKIKKWKNNHFKAKEQYEQLVQSFEQAYPKYYELKYGFSPIQIKQIQQQIDPTTLVIEYFVGQEQIYVFGIDKTNVQVVALKNEASLLQQVEQIRAFISHAPQSTGTKSNRMAFIQHASSLYQQLLAPLLQSTEASIRSLLIIPDDFLSYIPFDLLLVKTPESIAQSGTLEAAYLLQEQSISYHYSAQFLVNKSSKKDYKKQAAFAGFAPSFRNDQIALDRACTDGQLSSLNCNQSEVQTIQKLLGGEAFIGDASSKAAFENNLGAYQIIHLATHACVDEEDPMSSQIHFTDDPVLNYDLYNLQLNADLAVLSACNTGSGKLVKGEGVMSLARGFIQAGCPSVLMSLWSVDDCATSNVMTNFYQHLIDGKSKDQALREAKINYLETADKLHLHPYYWSAFVQFGKSQPLDFQKPTPISYFLIPLLLLGIVGFYFFKQKGTAKI